MARGRSPTGIQSFADSSILLCTRGARKQQSPWTLRAAETRRAILFCWRDTAEMARGRSPTGIHSSMGSSTLLWTSGSRTQRSRWSLRTAEPGRLPKCVSLNKRHCQLAGASVLPWTLSQSKWSHSQLLPSTQPIDPSLNSLIKGKTDYPFLLLF